MNDQTDVSGIGMFVCRNGTRREVPGLFRPTSLCWAPLCRSHRSHCWTAVGACFALRHPFHRDLTRESSIKRHLEVLWSGPLDVLRMWPPKRAVAFRATGMKEGRWPGRVGSGRGSRSQRFLIKILSKSIAFERRVGSAAAGDRKVNDFSLKSFQKASILSPGPGRSWMHPGTLHLLLSFSSIVNSI